MERGRVFGLLSIVILVVAIILASIKLFLTEQLFGFIYLGVIFFSSILVILFYCTKCAINDKCVHFIFGPIARIFPQREGKYNLIDYFFTMLGLLAIILFPQYWLVKDINYLISFWIMIFCAGGTIFLSVCNECENKNCALCRTKKQGER